MNKNYVFHGYGRCNQRTHDSLKTNTSLITGDSHPKPNIGLFY